MTDFITADNHFSHAKILEHCGRPFKSVAEMDLAMITRWNETVQPGDIVIHLGDFCMGGVEQAKFYLEQLNGIIKFIAPLTHHDSRWIKALAQTSAPWASKTDWVEYISPMETWMYKNWKAKSRSRTYSLKVTYNHFPMQSWDASYHGSVHLHGHVHGRLVEQNQYLNRLDIGVDGWDFEPVPLNHAIWCAMYDSPFEDVMFKHEEEKQE